MYGTDPVYHFLPAELVTGGVGDDEASTFLQDHQLFCDMHRQQLSKAQSRMKQYVDEKCSLVFQVGDQMYLKFQSYNQKSVASRLNPS